MPAPRGFRPQSQYESGVFFCGKRSVMAKIIEDLDGFISAVNTLYNFSSSAPSSGDEDYIVWTALANVAENTWEHDDGMLWGQLFVKVQDAPDGDKTTDGGTSYDCPTLFRFPASGYVWLGTGTNKTPYKVIKPQEAQLREIDSEHWCYFLNDATPTLEFNPNLTIASGLTINYNYYKFATKLTTGTSKFEMADPMYAVYYALSELKKEEGNAGELNMASEKLKAMEDSNEMPAWYQADQLIDKQTAGFGV